MHIRDVDFEGGDRKKTSWIMLNQKVAGMIKIKILPADAIKKYDQ